MIKKPILITAKNAIRHSKVIWPAGHMQIAFIVMNQLYVLNEVNNIEIIDY